MLNISNTMYVKVFTFPNDLRKHTLHCLVAATIRSYTHVTFCRLLECLLFSFSYEKILYVIYEYFNDIIVFSVFTNNLNKVKIQQINPTSRMTEKGWWLLADNTVYPYDKY